MMEQTVTTIKNLYSNRKEGKQINQYLQGHGHSMHTVRAAGAFVIETLLA